MLKLTLIVAGSGQEMYVGEVPSFAEADAVVRSLDVRWEGAWTHDTPPSQEEMQVIHDNLEPLLQNWEGSDVYAVDTDGKRFLNTSDGDWEQY